MLEDWTELCALLSAHGVEFLLVGGQAVIAHGYPRLTKDMDLWVRPTKENGGRVLAALAEFGAELNVTPEQFENPRTMIMLGRDPFRVDILTDIPAVEFEQAWSRRTSTMINAVEIPLLSKADLIANKKAAGRLQDLADAEALEKLD